MTLNAICAILPAKAVSKMTSTVLGGTLNPTHSLTHPVRACSCSQTVSANEKKDLVGLATVIPPFAKLLSSHHSSDCCNELSAHSDAAYCRGACVAVNLLV